jgi:hypothetical protein
LRKRLKFTGHCFFVLVVLALMEMMFAVVVVLVEIGTFVVAAVVFLFEKLAFVVVVEIGMSVVAVMCFLFEKIAIAVVAEIDTFVVVAVVVLFEEIAFAVVVETRMFVVVAVDFLFAEIAFVIVSVFVGVADRGGRIDEIAIHFRSTDLRGMTAQKQHRVLTELQSAIHLMFSRGLLLFSVFHLHLIGAIALEYSVPVELVVLFPVAVIVLSACPENLLLNLAVLRVECDFGFVV